jgi:hypothetical protein
MTGQASGSEIKEHIWLVALYEQEARADELLERLSAIGVDASEATTVRVEIDDQMRAAKGPPSANLSPLSPVTRTAVTGALYGGAAALVLGLAVYALGLGALMVFEGLFNHAILCVVIGATIGALVGVLLASAKQRKIARIPVAQLRQLRSEGFLVAVKMPPQLAEQAEEIARGLGAKEILL